MFAILAFLSFLLALFDLPVGEINLVELGLMFIALSLLIGPWPLGQLRITRS